MTLPGHDAPTWLFVPGTLCDARVFDPVIMALDTTLSGGVRVVQRLDSASLAALADEAVVGMAPNFHVVGFSLGCQVVMEIMRRYPERCIGLVLISTTAHADAPEMAPVRREMVSRFAQLGPHEFVETHLWPLYVAAPKTAGPEIKKLVMDMACETPCSTFADQIELAIGRPSSLADLARFAAPLLMINGAQDALTSTQMGAEIVAAAPDGTQAIIPNAGHFVLLEEAQRTSDAIREWCAGHVMR